MPSSFEVGDKVFIPATKVDDPSAHHAILEKTIDAVVNRSITVTHKGTSYKFGSSVAYRNVSVIIFCIGDYSSEEFLLNPLAKSILQYFRLLLEDAWLKLYHIRTKEEFSFLWEKNHALYSHVVFIGHGRKDAMQFGDKWLTAPELVRCLNVKDVTPKNYFSLCCKTGLKDFASPFSDAECVSCLVAPKNVCHAASGSEFIQTLFANHFLAGKQIKSAFNKTKKAASPGPKFRFWRDGRLESPP